MSRHVQPRLSVVLCSAVALVVLCLAAPIPVTGQTLGDGHRSWASLVTRGRAQAALGNPGDAVATFERAGEEAWTMREAVATQLALAEVLADSIDARGSSAGYDAESIQEMFHFASEAVSGHLRTRALIGHAGLLLRLGRPRQAVELLRRTEPADLDATDEIMRARFGLISGRALGATGSANDALTVLVGALRQDPESQEIVEQLLVAAREGDEDRSLAAFLGAAEVLIAADHVAGARDLLSRSLATVDWMQLSTEQRDELEALLARYFVAARTGPDEFAESWWPLVGGSPGSPGAAPSPRLRQLHTAYLHELTTSPDPRQVTELFSEWASEPQDARVLAELLTMICEHYGRSGVPARALERSTWAAGLTAENNADSRAAGRRDAPLTPADDDAVINAVSSLIAADPLFQGMALSVAVRDGDVALTGTGFAQLGDDDRDTLVELVRAIEGVSTVTAPPATGD